MSRSSLEHAAPTTRPSPPLGLGELGLLDEELYRLARSAGRLRLRIGQALHRLGDGYHELGFSTLSAYALERCCRGGRWAAESRALARRLESLPQLSAALESGSIGWSMAELLARHATPTIEAALLQVAGRKTVQTMRIALSPDEPPDDDELARTLSLTVPVDEAWALEATRMMVEHMDGHSAAHWLESLLAEGFVSLLERIDPSGNDFSEPIEAETTAWRTEMKHLQRQHAEAELQSHPAIATHPMAGDAPDLDDLPTGIEALDARIREYSTALSSRDLFFGRVAQRFLSLRGWQSLGFVSEAHYARERLGMSRASLRSKISLARRTQGLDQVVDALQQGRIGFEAAQLVARIASVDTERAWVERAAYRTFKHLREEVQAVELVTRLGGDTRRAPPSEAQIEQMQALERSILSGELLRNVGRNPDPDDAAEAPSEGERAVADAAQASEHAGEPASEAAAVQISGSPGGKVTLRMRLPGDVLLHYRQLERVHRRTLPGTSFIQFLCGAFWRTWVPTLGASDKWEAIYRRDRYRCTSPVCHQRNVTLHHVEYRARGGDDCPDNLTSPCAFCHLEGEHGGRLQILPPGSDPTWVLGRRPIMRIHRRDRTLLA